MKDNILANKSYTFAVDIVKNCQLLINKHELIFAGQLLRSGTSIGANVREAIGAQSRRDFISKISIAYKEALETEYWLQLLRDGGILEQGKAQELILKDKELIRIITQILLTTKSNDRRSENYDR